MKKQYIFLCLIVLIIAGCSSNNYSGRSINFEEDSNNRINEFEEVDVIRDDYIDEDSYDYGYEWAEDNDINDFDDCQYEFGTGDAEDGCNEYVKENYSGYRTFKGYECTEDCSGHEAGYEWAENNDISDIDDCGGNSRSFIEGCQAYVEDYY